MREDVLVRLKGVQSFRDAGRAGEEPVEILTAGTYRPENGSHVVLYDEVSEDGMEVTKNRMVLKQNAVEVHKSGEIDVDMIKKKKKNSISCYSTPYGDLEMGISTTALRMREWENRILAHINYALSMNGQHVADCVMDIRVESVRISPR